MRAALLLLAGAAAILAPSAAWAAYVRAGVAYEGSAEAGFRDLDCRRPGAPFGCGAAIDGRPFAATGDFGRTAALELGLGQPVLPYLRIEASAAWRPGLAFEGRATTPSGAGALSGGVDSLAGFVAAYVDFGGYGRARPYLGLAAGAARNRLAAAASPVLTSPGATTVEPAWMAAAGLGWLLTSRTTLDVALRHVDLGRVRSGGPAPIRSSVRADGVSIGLRRTF